MEPIYAVVLGAGSRGTIYASYAEAHPDELQIVAVAEPRPDRLKQFGDRFHVPEDRRYSSWETLLSQPKLADAAFICTMDNQHTEPALKALSQGYHILLEKPMSPSEEECRAMEKASRETGKTMAVCHVLRYTPFYQTLKALIDKGEIGKVCAITQIENVGYWHQAHSFVRGNWRNSDETSPMILQKCCHDMDIILWLMDKSCTKMSSMGSLSYFRPENAPEGATLRCTDDCKAKDSCPFNAEKFYLGENTGWPVSVISEDPSLEARRHALETGPYGRCVFHCDNNVVDHQVVTMEFEGGATATLTMCAFTPQPARSIEVMGTKGCIHADMHKFGSDAAHNNVMVYDFLTKQLETIVVDDGGVSTGHEGADQQLTMAFVQQVAEHNAEGRTSASRSVESHLMSLAAEKSRTEGGRVVPMEEMWAMG